MVNKCPYCGSTNIRNLNTESKSGVHYVLTCVDLTKNPNEFLPTNGFPVDAYGCKNCKAVILENEAL